jgi:Flp pilus assembly pilin Flp
VQLEAFFNETLGLASSSGRACSMATILPRFVRDQSGVITTEDGLTAFFLAIGIIAILSLLSTTFVGIYTGLDFLRAAH